MKIGFDIDGVLADFVSALLQRYEEKTGRHFNNEDVTEYWLWKAMGVSEEDLWEINNEMMTSGHPFSVYEDGRAAWNTAKREVAIPHIITSRDTRYRAPTARWLVSNAFFPATLFMGADDKGKACRGLGVTHFIEDSPDNAVALADAGIRVCLVPRPWTAQFEDTELIRVEQPDIWICQEVDRCA